MAESSDFVKTTIPKFDGFYDHWATLMENLLRSKEYWSLIEVGVTVAPANATSEQQRVANESKLNDMKVKNFLFQSIDRAILETILSRDTAKDIWDAMKTKYQGSNKVKRAQLQALCREFEVLAMGESESVNDYFARTLAIANKMTSYGERVEQVTVVEKVLRSMSAKFNYVVCSIEQSNDVTTLSIDELQSNLLVQEQRMKSQQTNHEEQALKASNGGRGSGRGKGRNSSRGRGRGRQSKDLIECYRCYKLGHYQSCSNHMVGNKDWLYDFDESYRDSVKLGDDSKMQVMGKGNVKLSINGRIHVITSVYYIPGLKTNLLSIGQIQQKNVTIVFKSDTCKAYHDDKGLLFATHMSANKMYVIKALVVIPKCLQASKEDTSQLWHMRYGHLSIKGLNTLVKMDMVRGLPDLEDFSEKCIDCLTGKQHREVIPKQAKWRASVKLDLVHSDICGPINPTSNGGNRYFITFTDDLTRKTWVYFLKEKSSAFDTFNNFKILVEKESGCVVQCLRTDRGGEFVSTAFDEFCRNHGIKRQLTTTYTPQQNGVSKRKNRTLMDIVRSMIAGKNVPKVFWPEAVKWATHIMNRSSTLSVKNITPKEAWSGVKPSVTHFRIFGCIAYAHVPDSQRTKLDDKSVMCVHLGVSDESKAYKLYDPKKKRIMINRDVVFDERKAWDWNNEGNKSVNQGTSNGIDDDTKANIVETNQANTQAINEKEINNEAENTLDQSDGKMYVENTSSDDEGESVQLPPRIRKTPAKLGDYVIGSQLDDQHNLAIYVPSDDSKSFDEAEKMEIWRKAMDQEMEAIENNNTWQLTTLPHGANVIGVKWIYKTKYNEKGEIEKHKARLVVKRYSQKHGVDYNDVFAPVARWETIRAILALAPNKNWKVYQLDVKSAFLHGELNEDIYVEQPLGYQKGNGDKVYKLRKALYGLKQAPRACLYVNGLICTGNNEHMIQEFKVSMKKRFAMTDLGKMKYFLGVEVIQYENGIFINQHKYAVKILKRFDMTNCNKVNSPIVPGCKFVKNENGEATDAREFKQMVGSLMYLLSTRPDLAYSVCLTARFMGMPTDVHITAIKRIMRYLKDILTHGIMYKHGSNEKLKLIGWFDSDFAGDLDDRKSSSGYVFKLGSGAISWSSKKQPIVTL
ncbi:hypothetical protein TSUD_277510 [Trifolium subterraneum]|uniref:Integrase catalytic domain-containing protein n=1 Tax=Trifolium subterraneum TaxID=3900 RepID=A0A2Z6NKZ0_TRISU|nr:hypothetical protein TSUD_277510 [Trifolium subterraneum]